MPEVVVAVDVGGTSIQGALVDTGGVATGIRTQSTREFATRGTLPDAIVGFAREMVELGRRHPGGLKVRAVGVVVPGLVDERRGVALSSMMLGWRDVPFVRLLKEEIRLPVGFGHDVRSAARAEGAYGAARGNTDFLYLSVGTGVGSCFVVDGRSLTGSHGLGGELAHLNVEPHGPPCRCGKYGCLEVVASARAVADRYSELAPRPAVPKQESGVTAERVAGRVRAGDPLATSVWRRAVGALGFAIATYIELLDPEMVVVGGGLVEAGELLLDPLRREAYRGVSERSEIPSVVGAGHGSLAGLHGAAILAREAAAPKNAGSRPTPDREPAT